MKNVHVLPTDKPSRLQLQMDGNFHIENGQSIALRNYLNIYITSNEEIKEGDWYITPNNTVLKALGKMLINVEDYKKIILTTNQELIQDGVQAIDDEFLEWFVKHPNCDEISVVDDTLTVKEMSSLPLGTRNHKYKIIIPKEETKQEQDNKMYNDDDMKNYAIYILLNDVISPKEWFNKFKNK